MTFKSTPVVTTDVAPPTPQEKITELLGRPYDLRSLKSARFVQPVNSAMRAAPTGGTAGQTLLGDVFVALEAGIIVILTKGQHSETILVPLTNITEIRLA
jgi:hypothetical protein